MNVVSPTGGRFGSVKARTRHVPVEADDTIGTFRLRPPSP
jgi:hypothetical protein